MATMTCQMCGKECERTGRVQKYCGGCVKVRERARCRARRQTPKYKAYAQVYEQTPKRKARTRARKQTLEYKAYAQVYEQTPKRKAGRRAHRQTPKYKARELARMQTPEYRAYMQAWRGNRKATDDFFLALAMTAAIQKGHT